MKYILSTIFILSFFSGCSQNNARNDIHVGGRSEGCEAIYESPVPFDRLKSVDTLPDFFEQGPKIEISGTIYHRDGKTPAKDIIMYLYHTDQAGLYSKKGNEKGWGLRHGNIRGWIKTDEKGQYKFYTLIPASYPNSTIVKHIHPTIKEPGFTEYWIDDFVFDDDPFLTEKEKAKPKPVAGNGVLKPQFKDGMLRASRDIILGLNVQDYPVN